MTKASFSRRGTLLLPFIVSYLENIVNGIIRRLYNTYVLRALHQEGGSRSMTQWSIDSCQHGNATIFRWVQFGNLMETQGILLCSILK